MKTIQYILIMLLMLVSAYSNAQTIVKVTYYDGTTQSFKVASAHKLYFGTENLYIEVSGNTTPTSIPVSIIRKITFSEDLSTGIASIDIKNNLVLYPNPTTAVLRIKSDIITNMNVRIYSVSGQLVQQGIYKPNENIDVSGLTAGLYIINTNNVTLKFIKQ